uniref:Synaptonemal complex central element protein 2 n=1 Tax=Chelonoidis abingdonii TaxID=106734 RepID=A0A8C0G3Z2_CHEAB
MSNFRDSLMLKVSSLAEKLEESMFLIYDCHNKQMQDKLQELSEIMERISQIQTELRQVCHTVEAAYKDLCVQSEINLVTGMLSVSSVSLTAGETEARRVACSRSMAEPGI